jgi:hypothetical protein
MPKFTLICEHDGPVASKNTLEFEADFLPTVLEHFRQFLKGCTFEFDGELEIVGLDYYKEPEPDYPDEYEEDYVGAQVFDNMATSLTSYGAGQPVEQTISITSIDLSDKCSVCGLPVAIMQRNKCFDAKCGLIK